MKKKILSLLAVLTLSVGLFGACGDFNDDETFKDQKENTADKSDASSDNSASKADIDDADLLSGIHHCKIAVKGYDPISVELDADNAPITVTNFVNLAKDGFYDGLTFIRIQEGFVIQGGDPAAVGRSDSASSIKGEFASNGVDNSITHDRGVLSMARTSDPDSASSQFFIVLDDSAKMSLDGQYAAFGKITEGLDVLDRIVNDYISYGDEANMGFIPDAANQPVIESITISD